MQGGQMGVKDEVLKKIKDILKVPVTNKDKNEALAAARVYFGTDIAHLANWTKYTQDINLIHWQDPEITWLLINNRLARQCAN
jgi:hypothetical protein